MTRMTFNDDFKKMVVELYHSGASVKNLSGEYGVSEVTIYKWIKQFTPMGSGDGAMTQKELAEMKKAMLRLQQENEILKKVMAIFAQK